MQVTTYSKYHSCKCFMREIHSDIICLTQFSRVTYSECHNKRLQIPYYTQDQKPTRSGRWPYKILVTFPGERFFFLFFARVKIRQANAQMPAYVPTLWCSSSYLLSSEQLAGNISPTSGAKHLSLGGGHRALVFQHANLAQFSDTSAPVWLGGMSVLFACRHTPDITY